MDIKDFKFLKSVGGKPVSSGMKTLTGRPDQVEEWNFGLLVDHGPDELQHTSVTKGLKRHFQDMRPSFQLTGRLSGDPKKVILWDVFRMPVVQKSMAATLQKMGGRSEIYPGNKQFSGSCVGVGSGDDICIAAAVEVAYKGDPELPVIFFWPYHYARGRFRGGMTSPGDGSYSEAQVEAIMEDGTYLATGEDIPLLKDNGDGLVLSNDREEISWSDGDAANIMRLVDTGRKHRFRSSAVIRNLDDARACIRDAKTPFLWCGSWGGMMKCPVVGNPPCLLNKKQGVWQHNETAMAWWDHPELGELFGIKNQWGNAHGIDPAGLPVGAYWVKAGDMEYQLRQGSCIVVSAFDGHPALDINFDWTA